MFGRICPFNDNQKIIAGWIDNLLMIRFRRKHAIPRTIANTGKIKKKKQNNYYSRHFLPTFLMTIDDKHWNGNNNDLLPYGYQ